MTTHSIFSPFIEDSEAQWSCLEHAAQKASEAEMMMGKKKQLEVQRAERQRKLKMVEPVQNIAPNISIPIPWERLDPVHGLLC